MTIKVGRSEFKVSTPANLDEKLVDLCGCSAKEMRQMIDGPVVPVTLAAALLPFIDGEISRQELGERIGKVGDLTELRNDVLALYDKATKPEGKSADAKAKA